MLDGGITSKPLLIRILLDSDLYVSIYGSLGSNQARLSSSEKPDQPLRKARPRIKLDMESSGKDRARAEQDPGLSQKPTLDCFLDLYSSRLLLELGPSLGSSWKFEPSFRLVLNRRKARSSVISKGSIELFSFFQSKICSINL